MNYTWKYKGKLKYVQDTALERVWEPPIFNKKNLSFFRINRLKVEFDEKLGVEFHSNELRQLRNLDSFRSELILLFSYIW